MKITYLISRKDENLRILSCLLALPWLLVSQVFNFSSQFHFSSQDSTFLLKTSHFFSRLHIFSLKTSSFSFTTPLFFFSQDFTFSSFSISGNRVISPSPRAVISPKNSQRPMSYLSISMVLSQTPQCHVYLPMRMLCISQRESYYFL